MAVSKILFHVIKWYYVIIVTIVVYGIFTFCTYFLCLFGNLNILAITWQSYYYFFIGKLLNYRQVRAGSV